MFIEDEFSIFDFASRISEVVDLISADLNGHHKRVAYIAYNIAREMNLPDEERKDIVLAAILHDIGAFTSAERSKIVSARFKDSRYDNHQHAGYILLRDFEPFTDAASLIRYHHAHFDKSVETVPLGSYIIHLADRISVLLDNRREILDQVPRIMSTIEKHRKIFHPDTLVAFCRLSKKEFFWIEAGLLSDNSILPARMRVAKIIVDLETLRGLAKLLSQLIDFRSHFTATHSSGVAAVAMELTKISGFSERECKLMEIAGYLHDIGKLAIPNEILEKQGPLDSGEFNVMRKHSYYTYNILNKIHGFENVAMWAAYHHERLDGNGYPFHIEGENFSRLARIMAIADIIVAITEDRPYRSGMEREKAIAVLLNMAENAVVDRGIAGIVKENFIHINDIRIHAQEKARQEYNNFSSA